MSEAKKSNDQKPAGQKVGNTFYLGSEPFFAFFTQAQVNISGLRMTFDENVVQQVADLSTHLENVRRKFLHDGDVVAAIREVRKAATKLDQRVQSWEAEAQNREKNKTKMSGEKIHKMKAEIARVRMKTNLSRRTLTKLLVELNQLSAGSLSKEDLGDLPKAKVLSAEEVAAAQKKRSESIEIVNPLLSELIDDTQSLTITSARFTAGSYPKGKEEIRDPGLAAFLVVGWYASQRTHRNGNNLDIDVWLIPKQPEVAAAFQILAPEIELSLRTPGDPPQPLELFALSAMSDVLPRSEQLRKFVNMIEQSNFASAGAGGLKVLRAQQAFASHADSFQSLYFKPFK